MNLPICSRCRKNPAVVFVTRTVNGKPVQDGLCLKCARELKIKPISDLLDKFGVSDSDIDTISSELLDGNGEMLEGLMQQIMPQQPDGQNPSPEFPDNEQDEDGTPFRAPAFPLMNLFRPAQKQEEQTADKKKPGNKRKFLSSYAIDLTARARDGKLDRVVGRDSETLRVIQILNRRQKNNPCLIGEPGVGKTAVAEGLAQRIAAGDVPAKLRNKEVWLLDMTSMVAGTQFRGQFEARMKSLIDEVKGLGNIILVIDEVHNLVGAGDAEGSMNAANILKPALSRGEIQVIGATTFGEYRKYIEKDSALERRFQPVTVEEPSLSDTAEMVKGIKEYYEGYHKVKVSSAIVERAVALSERYITDRFLPDKAIDLLDEACSYASMRSKELAEYEETASSIEELTAEQEKLEADTEHTDYEAIAKVKADLIGLQSKLEKVAPGALDVRVSEEDLAKVIELWTGIPAAKIQQSEYGRISDLEKRLKDKIVGQDEAVKSVVAAIKRSRANISPRHRPASFIFVGPTGVGKTELVKVLASELFDSVEPLIRLDMSEYMEKYAVSKIIGSPPGYVGYDEAGQLTEKVRRKPYSVVLFDEIEKAHPDVMNILLQILDEGRITDSHGRTVNFENTVIVMTSNAGSDKKDSPMGFNKTERDISREKVQKSLSEFLRPEFLSRVDEVVIFNPLDDESYGKIAKLMLDELKEPLKDRGITLSYDDSAIAVLVGKAKGQKHAARDLRHAITREVEDRIADIVMERYGEDIRQIVVSADEGKITVAAA